MTIFAQIIAGEIPCDKIYEDDLCIVIKDINPKAQIHWLIIPKKPLAKISDAATEDKELLGHLLLVAGEVTRAQDITDFRLLVNNGPGAGQIVFHLHIHVLAGSTMGEF